MKFQFKPQTGILVAGLLAATYAEACYWQQTDAVCVTSGSTVDEIYWQDGTLGGTKQDVVVSADWIVNAQAGHFVVTGVPNTGTGPFGSTASDGGTLPTYCSGAVHFKDGAGNTVSASVWYAGSTDITGVKQPITPNSQGVYAGTGSGTCS